MAEYNLAIEVGTSNTVIYIAGLGVALKEPSIIALETVKNKKVVKSVGLEAKKLVGKEINNIEIVYPITEGVITNFQYTKLMLKEFLKKVTPAGSSRKKYKAIFLHSCGLTEEEKGRIRDLSYALNMSTPALLPSGICALVGMRVDENDTKSHMVLNIGGGVTDISIINSYKLIRGANVNIGGNQIDANIGELLKQKYEILLDRSSLENIKNNISSLLVNDISVINVVGLDKNTKHRKEIRLFSQEVYPVVSSAFNNVAEACEKVLKECSNEVLLDINKYGIYVCGGVANITGIAKYLNNILKAPVYVDLEPDSTAIVGAGTLLNNQILLQNICDGLN